MNWAELRSLVLDGLAQPVKRLPCQLLYGGVGAQLFEDVTEAKDYYLSRAETKLLAEAVPAIAPVVGPRARVIEPGCGSARKTRILLSGLDSPAIYVPIDIAQEQLAASAAVLRAEHPELVVTPVTADFTQMISLPPLHGGVGKTLVFFPGSTIGNFEPYAARDLMARFERMAGRRALLLLGADSNNEPSELCRAYDDSEGKTAAFNMNVLAFLNDRFGATFSMEQFEHRAIWNAPLSRIEMHLVSRCRQVVEVSGRRFRIDRGEHIITEHCYKHSPSVLARILQDSGWTVRGTFVDTEQRMRLWLAAS